MIVYNGFLFLSTKSISYLHYVLLTASMALFQIADSGQGYAYLWPNHPGGIKSASASWQA